jgi:hypothetical protein
MGPGPSGAAQFFVDGQYVRAGSDNGPIVFNIRDNGNHISIGDGMGQSHHLSTFQKDDKMALAATAVAWLGDMRLRNPGADVVDASVYESSIDGQAYRNYQQFQGTRGNNKVHWANRSVPDDLIAKFGRDTLSPETSRRLMESRVPASFNRRYDWCGDSEHNQRSEAFKEAEEIAMAEGLEQFTFDGKTWNCGLPPDDCYDESSVAANLRAQESLREDMAKPEPPWTVMLVVKTALVGIGILVLLQLYCNWVNSY